MADGIYVYDGGSTDGTWELVQSLDNPRIIAWKQDGKVFQEGLRAEVFNEFRSRSSPGDWWLQLNADEFYPEDPRGFFSRVPPGHDFVWGINVEYYLTWKDVRELDFSRPFPELMPRMKYYNCNWSEPRAFRYRHRLVWDESCAWPYHAGLVHPERLVFKHYPYRSPQQIQMRLDVRRDNRARGFPGWEHAKETDWKAKIADFEKCQYDDGHQPLQIDGAKLPRHLESPWVRCLKRIMRGTRLWP